MSRSKVTSRNDYEMSESFFKWDPAQVAQHFLTQLGEDVRESFIGHNIDGSLLPFLTTEHLRELGIELLASRLRLKKKINELLSLSFVNTVLKTPDGESHCLNAIDINSNYVSIEALSLCVNLLRDLSQSTRRMSDETADFKKLNENFKKLKMDLNPVIRLVKDSKPLPTPTLDPGVSASLPTQSIHSILSTHSWASDSDNGQTPTTATTLILPESSPTKPEFTTHSLSPLNVPSPSESLSAGSLHSQHGVIPKPISSSSTAKLKQGMSPTQSHRFSSGSVLSVGVGKVTDMKMGSSRFPSKPRLVDAKTSSASVEDTNEAIKYKTLLRQNSSSGNRPALPKNKLSSALVTSSNSPAQAGQASQPLKQLKASSEDTCLKVLQHAMKRHHIPREKWSKYVLVVCYGDKERILKLTERPVIIFKELQEHGQNPTIMLRERASTSGSERDYEDARIGDDIPGGTL